RWMRSSEPLGRQRTYPVAYAAIACVISVFPANAPEKRIVPYVWPLYAGLPKSRMTTPVAPRLAAPQPCSRKTLGVVVLSYSEIVARVGAFGFGSCLRRTARTCTWTLATALARSFRLARKGWGRVTGA